MIGDVNLVNYDAMVSAIDAAYEVDEVKDLRDKAPAYSKQAHNIEAEACEFRLAGLIDHLDREGDGDG